MQSTKHLEDSLVQVLNHRGGEPIGAGFLVDKLFVITCAHVVNRALGREVNQTGRPNGDIFLRFHARRSQQVTASVEDWNDPPATRSSGADICLLRLKAPADTIDIAQLAIFEDLQGSRFRAGGFPAEWDFDIATGQIVGRDTNELYLLRPTDAALAVISTHNFVPLFGDQTRPAGIIHEGFSGGPVEVGSKIAGMLVAAKERVADATAYMVPVLHFPSRILQHATRASARSVPVVNFPPPEPPNWERVINYLGCIARDSTSGIADDRSDAIPLYVSRSVARPPERESRMDRTEPIGAALQRDKRFVLLGEAGMGKSTALQYLERTVAARTIDQTFGGQEYWIPILVEMKSYRGQSELEQMLAARVNAVLSRTKDSLSPDSNEATRIIKTWLKDEHYRFIILIDALDETPAQFHQDVRTAVETLLNYPHYFVISCRTGEYDYSLKLGLPFTLIKLQPLEIQEYLRQSLPAIGDNLFRQQMENNSEMMTLASNPLFLNLMVDIMRQNPVAQIADNLGKLLEQFVEAMPRLRQKKKFKLAVKPDIVLTVLCWLGAEMFERNERTPELKGVRTWNIAHPPSPSIDDSLSEAKAWGLLRSDGANGGLIEFIHPLFVEYFAAASLDAQLFGNAPDYKAVLGNKIQYGRWRLPIAMLAGISKQPKGIAAYVANHLVTRSSELVTVTDFSIPFLQQVDWNRWLPAMVVNYWMSTMQVGDTEATLLMRCWQVCAPVERLNIQGTVVTALCTLLSPSSGQWSVEKGLWGVPSLLSERIASIAALRKIGDVAALPCLDELAGFIPPKEVSAIGHAIWSTLTYKASEAAALIRRRALLSK